MSFESVRRVLRDRVLIIVLAMMVGLAGGFAASKAMHQKYTATATLLFIPVGGGSLTDVGQGSQFVQNQLKTLSVVGSASEFLQPIIKQNNLQETPAELADELSISSEANTLIMTVDATNADKAKSVTIANAVAGSLLADINAYTPLSNGGKGVMTGKMLDKADAATAKQSPGTALYSLLGLAVGLLAGLVIAFMVGAKDPAPARPSEAGATAVTTGE